MENAIDTSAPTVYAAAENNTAFDSKLIVDSPEKNSIPMNEVNPDSFGSDAVALEQEKSVILKSGAQFFISQCICESGEKMTVEMQTIQTPSATADSINEQPIQTEAKKELPIVNESIEIDDSKTTWHCYWRHMQNFMPGVIFLFGVGFQNCFTTYDLDESMKGDPVFKIQPSFNSILFGFYGNPKYKLASTILAWFIGSLIGSIVGSILVRAIKLQTFYYVCGLLQIISGAILLAVEVNPFMMSIATRTLSGIIFGMVHLAVTVLASNISSKKIRHFTSMTITFTIAISNAIYAVATYVLFYRGMEIKWFGIDMICGAIAAIILMWCVVNKELDFLPNHKGLRRFDDIDAGRPVSAELVRKDYINAKNRLRGSNLYNLFVIICAKLLHVCFTNISSNLDLTKLYIYVFPGMLPRYYWLSGVFAARFVIGFIVLVIASYIGRHRFFYGLTILTTTLSLTMFIMGYFMDSFVNFSIRRIILMDLSVLVLAGFNCISLGLDAHQHMQTVDAFSFGKESWLISITAIFEHIVHMLVLMAYFFSVYNVILNYVVAFLVSILLLVIVGRTKY